MRRSIWGQARINRRTESGTEAERGHGNADRHDEAPKDDSGRLLIFFRLRLVDQSSEKAMEQWSARKFLVNVADDGALSFELLRADGRSGQVMERPGLIGTDDLQSEYRA